jgi:hypothetical protein
MGIDDGIVCIYICGLYDKIPFSKPWNNDDIILRNCMVYGNL